MDYKKDMREHLEKYCEMSDEERKAYVEEHDKPTDKVEKIDRYCSLDETDRMEFIEEHRDEYKAHMKDKMHDKMSDVKMTMNMIDYVQWLNHRAAITDVAKLDKV